MRFLIRSLLVIVVLVVAVFVGVLIVGSGLTPDPKQVEKVIPYAP